MSLSLTQTATVRITAGQAITPNLLRLLALSPSVSISGSVGTADLSAGAVTAAKSTPGAYWFGTTTGGTTAYVLTLNPSLGALADGVQIWFKVNATNTNAATLNVNGLGVVNLKRNGADIVQGDLLINRIYCAVYNSTGPSWDLVGRLGNPDQRYETAGGTANALTFTSTGADAVNSLSALRGRLLAFRVASTNTGAATLAVDGLTAKDIKHAGQVALAGGELVAGEIAWVAYSSINDNFQLMNPTPRVQPAPVPVASCRNLEIRSSSTTQAVVTADEVVLKSTTSTQVARMFTSVSVTLDVNGGVALNAHETGGSRATSHWYYIWLISDGTNVRGVLEDAGAGDGAAPAGPDLSGGAFSGYTYQALIGQLRLNATGSGEIVAFHQRDRRVWINETNVLSTSANGASATYIVLAAPTNFRAAVPPNANSCFGIVGTNETGGSARHSVAACANDGTADTTNLVGACHVVAAASGSAYESFGACGFFHVSVRGGAASRNIQWKADATTNDTRINITGYTF